MSDEKSPDILHLKETGTAIPVQYNPRVSHSRLLLFLVVLFVLATVALSVCLAFTVLRVDKNDDEESSSDAAKIVGPTSSTRQDEVCLTEGCVLAAANIRSKMDPTVNPCDDFYEFACGSWMRTTVIPEDEGHTGTLFKVDDDVFIKLRYLLEEETKSSEPAAIHKAKDFFKGCVDEKKIEATGLDFIHSYMESLGGWPVLGTSLGGNWNQANFNLEDLLILLRNESSSIPFATIFVSSDDKNPKKYILKMDQASLGMPSREYYLKARNDTTLMAYQTMIADIAIVLGADKVTAEHDAKDIVDLERELAGITVRPEDRRDPERLYNKMRLGDMSKNFTGVNWIKLVKGTFHHVNMEIDESEPVVLTSPSYYKNLGGMLRNKSPRLLANYIVWNRILAKLFYLPSEFREIQQKYIKVLHGTGIQPPRWRTCAMNTMNLMKQVVGRLFVEKYFSKEAKLDVMVMINNLQQAFKEMIQELDWMEDETKDYARIKVDLLEPRIGYSDWMFDNEKINEKYELVSISPDNPMMSLISINKAAVQRNLRKLRQAYDRTWWRRSTAEVNAFYSPTTNQITFLAAILQPPVYSKDQPSYLNYGGIGYIIGHEMTHGFDDQGRAFDYAGNLKSWWTPTDDAKYKQKSRCMVNQYNEFVVPGTGNMTINGAFTLGENIADNGGVKESFRAYQKWVTANGKEPKLPGLSYNANQLFFLNAAQTWCGKYRDEAKVVHILTNPHSLDMYRVYGPLQNSEDFADAFKCPVGSKMNPRDKCTVW